MLFNKLILIIVCWLMSVVMYAHQPELSTVILSQTEDGKDILQINSALTAFISEIEYIYSKNSYKTPEEFKDLVLDHFNKNVIIILNERDTLRFSNPIVLLGHDTRLIAEVVGFPKNIRSIYIKNTIFKDIPRNQTAVIMLKNGFPTQSYLLTNENFQEIYLTRQNGTWIEKKSHYDNHIKIFYQYIKSGFEHVIPLGLDHILFIIALFFLNSNLYSSVLQASMFTLAHTITLILSGLGYITPNPKIVEPVIAFSIFIMAMQNISAAKLNHYRLALVFFFGLIHGLGFASAFLSLQIPSKLVLNSLFAFNVGVELAQILMLFMLYYGFAKWFSHKNWYQRYIVKAVSIPIGLTALFFLFQRL